VGTIWLGFDKRSTVVRGATGGELAAPVWGRIMARLGSESPDWTMPAGVETRVIDDMGNVYAENCPMVGATHEEYFLSGTAPIATCYTDPGYMYSDSFGYPVDTLATDEAWWQRMRRRIFGARDTVRTDTFAVPVRPRVDTMLIDSFRMRQDSARRARNDTTHKPPRDTLRKPLPDTIIPDTFRIISDTLRQMSR